MNICTSLVRVGIGVVLPAMLIGVASCSDDATSPNDQPPTFGTADGELFRAEITSELCRIEASCNLGMLPDDADRCATFVGRSPFAPPAAPNLDPSQTDICLTALANLSCEDALVFMTADEGFRDTCLSAVVGEQPEGATCASDYDCQADLECVASPLDGPCATCVVEDACGGTCGAGQRCSDGACVDGCVEDSNCVASEYCASDSGTCAPRAAEGEPCDARPCAIGMKCVRVEPEGGPACVRPRLVELGASCDQLTTLCGDGARCDFATERCVESRSAGEACPDPSACDIGLVCVDGTCLEPRRAGEPCQAAAECWSGMCEDATCQALSQPQNACQP